MLGTLLTTTLLFAQPATAQAPPAPPALSELLALRAENHLLRLRLAQLEAQIQQEALTRQRAELEAAIAAAHPGWRMDWGTGQLVPVEKEPTP